MAQPTTDTVYTREYQPALQSFDPQYSLTFAPVMLLGPILQVNVERKLSRHVSASLFGGGGGRPGDPSVVFADAGATVRFYPLTSTFWKGPHIGMQTSWAAAWVEGWDEVAGERDRGAGHVITAGPLFGYKYIWRSGFTMEFQIVVAIGQMRGEGDFLGPGEEPHWRRASLALPFWNVGWSF